MKSNCAIGAGAVRNMRFEIQTAWVDGYKGRTFGTAPDAATMLAAVMAVSDECVAAEVRGGSGK